MTEALTSAFTTAFQNIAADVSSTLVIVVPVALSIAGVVFVARKAMSWFKSMAR